MEETTEYEVGPLLEPVEQHTIIFYGKPLIVVRLPDGSPAVALNSLCENMGLEPRPQLRRVQRTKAIAAGLASTRIETPGGPQTAYVLTLRVVPGWLFGIDAGRARADMRPEIERYQAECVDVLYRWAATPRLEAPAGLVNAEPITKPETPVRDASIEQWRDYYQRMLAFTDWQLSVEQWQGSVEGRLESIEAIIPIILEQLPPPTITARHQNDVKHYVSELSKATKKPYQTIWSMMYAAFQVPRYEELREDHWDDIQQWFRRQFKLVGRDLPGDEQGRLL